MAVMKNTFDPAKHLEKQGWKGKGTALKQGHATRPLAVVQKKTLSGIGKDRDEAVPFWDHIFAATAATLFIPSASSSPAPPKPNWATLPPASAPGSQNSSPAPQLPQKRLSINAQARISREMARRQLYSRFLRGKVVIPDTEKDIEETEKEWAESKASEVKAVVEASSSGPAVVVSEEKKETKEERKARKAEKKAKKEARLARADKSEKRYDKGKSKDGSGELVSLKVKEEKGEKSEKKDRKDKKDKSDKDKKESKKVAEGLEKKKRKERDGEGDVPKSKKAKE